MSLNKFMHPRNRYKYKKPDFEELGEKYPEFKQHLVENHKGKPVLDFKNPDAVRVLTTCLLQEDYGLKIEIPPDRLVPTLPLRLNYLHWIEDITKDWNKQELSAIDIGTGACCVYPILAVSGNPWRFLATEADEVNFCYATKNLEENKLTDRIKVVKVTEDTILEGVIGSTEEVYDFCMCNPPFFADHFEAQGLVSRTPNRPDPKTMSTASPQEGIVQGGEIAFARKMIEESNFLRDRVRVYTTMLGKKASLAPLKEILRRHKIENFASTEFCQGKTMRWGLAWSFDKSVNFPKSEFSQGKKEGKKSVVHIIPTRMGERREQVYDLVVFFKQIFSELRIHCREGKQTKFFALLTLTAAENTWIHSRRKRRQMMRGTAAGSTAVTSTEAAATSSDPSVSVSVTSTEATATSSNPSESVTLQSNEKAVKAALERSACAEMKAVTAVSVDGETGEKGAEASESVGSEAPTSDPGESAADVGTRNPKRKADSQMTEPSEEAPAKQAKLETESPGRYLPNGAEAAKREAAEDGQASLVGAEADLVAAEGQLLKEEESTRGKDRPPAQFVLKCHMCVRVQGADLALELTWLGGNDIQLMHQLMQVLKNRLVGRKPA